jgi:hypothetical protein
LWFTVLKDNMGFYKIFCLGLSGCDLVLKRLQNKRENRKGKKEKKEKCRGATFQPKPKGRPRPISALFRIGTRCPLSFQ